MARISMRNVQKSSVSECFDTPFTYNGSIVEVFSDLTLWIGIKRVIDRINANAIAA